MGNISVMASSWDLWWLVDLEYLGCESWGCGVVICGRRCRVCLFSCELLGNCRRCFELWLLTSCYALKSCELMRTGTYCCCCLSCSVSCFLKLRSEALYELTATSELRE